ncbi:MAG: peptidoglycan DD-metalloendopeptidase family protein [bacterium]
MLIKKRLSGILSVILCSIILTGLFSSVYGQDSFQEKIETNEKKLQEIKEKLERVKSVNDSIQMQRTKTLMILNRMDEEIYLTDLLIKELEKRDSLLTVNIENLNNDIDSLEVKLNERKQKLQSRLVDMYKKGKVHTFEVVFTSESFSELSEGIKYLSMIARQDKILYDKVRRTKDLLDLKKQQLEMSREQLEIVQVEADREKETLQIEKNNKQQFLAELSGRQSKQKALEKELNESKESLQYLINKLRVANKKITKKRDVAEGKHYFDRNKKKVVWPVDEYSIISRFGSVRHPKYNTQTINNGIDLKVDMGAPVIAVYDGDIIYADKFLGYGNVIMVDHGNGYYSLYAHLDEMNVILNQPVMAGETIGTCGDSGSLSGPILHFEIRKDGKPLNPLNFLK